MRNHVNFLFSFMTLLLSVPLWFTVASCRSNLPTSFEKIDIPQIVYYLPAEDKELKKWLQNI